MPKSVWDTTASVAENARRYLPPLVQSYFGEGRKLMRGKWSSAEFHAFRLQTKRLRYTLELFRPCYGPGLERCIDGLRGLQDYLGEISDCATIREILRHSKQRARIEKMLKARARSAIAGLKKHWRQSFDRPGEERRWINYFERHAR